MADDAILKTGVDAGRLSLETELDTASQSLDTAMTDLVATLSTKVASNADMTSFEAALAVKGLHTVLTNQANNQLPNKRDIDPTITRTAVNALFEAVEQDRDALSTEAATNYAETGDIVALRTAADATIAADRVYTRAAVDVQTAALAAALATKADVASTATEEEVQAAVAKASPVMMPKGDVGCAVADVNSVKYNPSSRKFEVCSQGTLRHHWRPVGSSKDCVTVDAGRCTRCDGGLAVSRSGGCVPAAEMVHLDLNNNKVNQAPHANAEPPTLTNLAVRSLVDCSL